MTGQHLTPGPRVDLSLTRTGPVAHDGPQPGPEVPRQNPQRVQQDVRGGLPEEQQEQPGRVLAKDGPQGEGGARGGGLQLAGEPDQDARANQGGQRAAQDRGQSGALERSEIDIKIL